MPEPKPKKARAVKNNLELHLTDSITTCPHCREQFYFKKGIVIERALKVDVTAEPTVPRAAMPDFEREIVHEMLASGHGLPLLEQFKRFFYDRADPDAPNKKAYDPASYSGVFHCPNCEEGVQLQLQIAVIGCVSAAVQAEKVAEKESTPAVDPLLKLTPEDRQLYEEWTDCGLLNLFIKAMEFGNPGSVPQKPDRQVNMVRTWFRTSSYCKVPGRSLAKFVLELNTADIRFYQSQGIVGIVADDHLRTFLSRAAVMGYGNERLVFNPAGGNLAETWHKSRFGYAAGRGIFFSALQLESRASMGSATGKQRGTQSPAGKGEKETL